VKARAAYRMNVAFDEDRTDLFFSVMPYYSLEGLTIFCDIGYKADAKKDADPAADTQFFVNPYVTVPISGGKFQVGLKVNGNGKTDAVDDVVKWSVPMLLGFGF